jgi:MarR family transcriptional regulator, organic hydroperoxide resistance regulator
MRRDDHELILLITRTTLQIRAAVQHALADYGLQRPWNLVLDALAAEDGLTPGQIAEHLQVSGPTAVKMAQRMEAKGLVERRRDGPDGRLVRVYLTPHGRDIQSPVRRAVDRVSARAVAGLTAGERNAITEALTKVRANLGDDDLDDGSDAS